MHKTTRLRCTGKPSYWPITLEDAKTHLRVGDTAEDALILANLVAATELVEKEAGRQLLTATYEYSLSTIHGTPWYCGSEFASASSWWPLCYPFTLNPAHAVIPLPKPPLISVSSVQYYDSSDALLTLDSSKYRVLRDDESPGLLVITDVPAMSLREDALKITFTAGYGNQEDVPEIAKLAIRLLLAEFYRNREATVKGLSITELPIGIQRLIGILKVMEFQ